MNVNALANITKMQNIVPIHINARYMLPESSNWCGRKTAPEKGILYWHQLISLENAQKIERSDFHDSIVLLGYASDAGVKRNNGRPGARKGPEFFRKSLAKLPVHFDFKRVADLGDIESIDEDMESCQEMLSVIITKLLGMKIFPIVIGGGHELAYGHFKGIAHHLKNSGNKKIGIINFDAHFDLRPVESKSNSGTPFYQILSEFRDGNFDTEYFAIGIQKQSNTRELFQIAKNVKADFSLNKADESLTEEMNSLLIRLKVFIERNDYIYLTIDMDGFSSAFAPGVSAPSPLGFTPHFMFRMLRFIFSSGKVISLDIAELNPEFDRDNMTALLAAELVDYIATNFNLSQS